MASPAAAPDNAVSFTKQWAHKSSLEKHTDWVVTTVRELLAFDNEQQVEELHIIYQSVGMDIGRAPVERELPSMVKRWQLFVSLSYADQVLYIDDHISYAFDHTQVAFLGPRDRDIQLNIHKQTNPNLILIFPHLPEFVKNLGTHRAGRSLAGIFLGSATSPRAMKWKDWIWFELINLTGPQNSLPSWSDEVLLDRVLQYENVRAPGPLRNPRDDPNNLPRANEILRRRD
ncbi:uncharacterized protein GGS25DRAFT_526263 [Hypoxylon fragiforme]|uniref:uncharacterized protein n=1 Tax=Hypoxylon fragiforme TaxID=63214 RepID=UPI0020C68579|nr:uncharacterized protein GGS25DRAFT_526263 [Hypoxylon fragiforme]KAI2603221.1 hypothetical protein GGS25DRAFT_526263 [Hypoxylon fragiforme]